ncbi:hypothetical protein M422DRAFT_53165 [Sphaerobolus stellatus SS14]|uniref:Uncharacterized protein n=1 Tax=Sphaerobolus stellatus (strain SS14) TaxID=990650 RepID=A0A0C9V2Y2_SPHS4|nr:hypothetical protein M422DRAFT_53165 [Sphaerobolus stellatus SS14]
MCFSDAHASKQHECETPHSARFIVEISYISYPTCAHQQCCFSCTTVHSTQPAYNMPPWSHASTVPRGQAQTQCPFCDRFLKRISRHYASHPTCKAKANALQQAIMDEPTIESETEDQEENITMEDNPTLHSSLVGNVDCLPPAQFPLSPSRRPSKQPRHSPGTPSSSMVPSMSMPMTLNHPLTTSMQPSGHIPSENIPDDVFGNSGQSSPRPNLFSASQSFPHGVSGPPISHPGGTEEMSVHAEQPGEEDDQEDTPFEAENTFQLYAKYEYPSAGKVRAICQSTIFHAMDKAIPAAYPYMPFFSEE